MTTEMITTSETRKTYEKMAILHHEVLSKGNNEVARKLAELVEKAKNQEWIIGFCGHFSAGKSTMINRIAGVDLLPSNPIPTSANLAKIRNDNNARAIIDYNNGDTLEMPYPYDLQEIRRSAIDGMVRSIEINHPLPEFPEGVSLLDTPGIDSTDETHLASTKSALHLADIILYVTDYNHVLSDLNMAFLKQLQNQNKRIVLIVNQIDKHLKAELGFDEYKKGIAESFQERKIHPERIFYTSLKKNELPENQFAELKSFILGVSSEKDHKVEENAELAAKQLIEEYIDDLYEEGSEERETFEHQLNDMSREERMNVKHRYDQLTQEWQQIKEKPERLDEKGKQRINETLSSAILMPYETREAGRYYVESIQPEFKVGLFGSRKKTEQERENRLNEFHKKTIETSAALDWQMKELLVKLADEFSISDGDFKQSIYDLKIEFESELLTDQVQQGATFNADYVLRYTEKAADAIKQLYRKKAYEKLAQAVSILEQSSIERANSIRNELDEIEEKTTALNALFHADEKLKTERDRLLAILSEDIDKTQLEAAFSSLPTKKQTRIVSHTEVAQNPDEDKMPKQTSTRDVLEITDSKQVQQTEDFRKRLNDTATNLKETAKRLQIFKGFQTSAKEMTDRANRLENNRFTVALFGAFSAGKSSFANALIGENALPVSPNPTTAAINQILPIDNDHPHRSAVIHIKKEIEMLEDVREILKSTDIWIERLEELPALINQIDANPFLQNVAKGYSEFQDIMGTQQKVDFETFNEMVSIERKAVFVESIELYYDCPLTRQGITLVDTPGADSINARHTDVAFEYIKNADAILFVTYYNHAFSRADREFLIQLGRVKDSFAMDKMFFIVNASDLANSDDELNAVVDYVGKNLQTYGVRHPRIFPVSSKQALKQADESFKDFEKAFHHFTMEELTNVAVQAAHDEVSRVVRTLDSFISSAREDESVKRQKYESTVQTNQLVLDRIQNQGSSTEVQALSQEIDQLLYYLEQRVFLRFPDLFKETFNPGTLGGNGTVKKETLQKCLNELVQVFGYDLAQEMRATALRAENFAVSLLKEHTNQIEIEASSISNEYSFSAYETPSFEAIRFENAFEEMDFSGFSKILGIYKNAKQFFEKDGRSEMKERLQESLKKPVNAYLQKNGERLKSKYIEIYQKEAEVMKERMAKEAREYAEGKLAALSVEVDADKLEQTKNEVDQIWN